MSYGAVKYGGVGPGRAYHARGVLPDDAVVNFKWINWNGDWLFSGAQTYNSYQDMLEYGSSYWSNNQRDHIYVYERNPSAPKVPYGASRSYYLRRWYEENAPTQSRLQQIKALVASGVAPAPMLVDPKPPGLMGRAAPALRRGRPLRRTKPRIARHGRGMRGFGVDPDRVSYCSDPVFPCYRLQAIGQDEPQLAPSAISAGELCTTMIVRGAAGALIGAAVAPPGSEGIWGTAGFVMGTTLGQIGIVGVALGALWRKAG